MKPELVPSTRRLTAAVLGLLTGLFLTACNKSEEEATTPATAATETPAEGDAAAEGTEAADASGEEESTTDAFVISTDPIDVGQAMTTTDQAMQNKDWTKATETLLQVQASGSAQSFEQSWDYNRRMTQLQNELLQAAEGGDARAKAAIEVLRRTRRIP